MADDESMRDDDDAVSTYSSDDDSDSQGLVEVSEADMNLIIQLEAKLEEDPSIYDAYVQFIDVLRRCKMMERLREVRRAMHERFPLSESLWLDWITDELESISGEEDIPKIEDLLDSAQNDYLSIALWIQKLEFVSNFSPEVQAGTPKGLQRMRDAAEEALSYHGAGLHCTEGSKLWDWYVNFERSQESKEGMTPEEREEAAERVRKLYRRRLAVPLHDGEETMKVYIAWEKERKISTSGTAMEGDIEGEDTDDSSLVPKQVKRSFDFARRAYELRKPFEEALVTSGASNNPAELLSAFMSYIKLEEDGTAEDSTTFSRVELMYERAVAAFPVTSFLWLQYGRYIEVVVQSSLAAERIYARGLRNCPWVGELYERMMRLVERTGTSITEGGFTCVSPEFEERHEAIFNKAMTVTLISPEDYILVGLARLDFLRRQRHVNICSRDESALLDRVCSVYSILKSTIQEKFPDFYDPSFQLAEYSATLGVKLSRNNEGIEAGRKIWEDALKAGHGAAAKSAPVWLKYIEFLKSHLPRGSFVQGIRDLFKRCHAREMDGYGQLEICNAWLKFEREEGSANDYFNAWCVAGPIIAHATAAALQTGYAAAGAAEAVKAQPVLSKEEAKALRQQKDPNFLKKKRKIEQTQHQNNKTDGGGGGAKRSKIEKAPEKTQPDAITTSEPPAIVPKDNNTTINAADTKEAPSKDFAARRALTAFIKHLPEDATEDSLRELFSPCGVINHVKLGIDHATGRHKGFAYIEFASSESLEAACKLNGTSVDDKILFVAPSNPPADGPGGRGGVVSGRGDRGGRAGGRGGGRGGRGRGGIAYSGGGGGGQVAKATQRGHLDISGSGESGNTNNGAPANFKPVVGFVPRAAAIPKKSFAKSGGGGGGDEEPIKSNADFRKMLLEKKS
ncbi:putative Squamous cell carcinoma antigen recognized by T-cells 3 [Nannochloris sp. 'desiccata']|nr:hypothetical protein KSW81_008277 [Chlorella desiccata (nom. nud.)]KAH7619562.1 putative Squamous cell carcinoma antigen recognized by T-cells 3 [Chlorella desiccata (nom. nud.)]